MDYYTQVSDICGSMMEKYGGKCCHICSLIPIKTPECRKCAYG